jgi:hypothetical protein
MQPKRVESFPAVKWCLHIVIAALLLMNRVYGAEDANVPTPSPAESDMRKIEGIFGSDLPTTERKGSVRLIVHPHFGDLTNRDYIRVLTGFRFGVTDHLELSAAVESYIDHGLKHTSPGSGVGDVRFGGKYGFGERLIPGYETSVGLNLLFPVDHPPVGMITGRNEYSPYFVIGKRLTGHPGLTLFLNTGVNFLEKTSIPGTFERNTPHSNSFSVTPGLVYTHYPFHYTLEFTYETTSLIGEDNKQFFTIRPGIAWDLPPRLKFHSKGRVTVAVGVHVTLGPDGTSTGGGGKLRAEFGISRWFRRDAKDSALSDAGPGSFVRH